MIKLNKSQIDLNVREWMWTIMQDKVNDKPLMNRTIRHPSTRDNIKSFSRVVDASYSMSCFFLQSAHANTEAAELIKSLLRTTTT